MTTQVGSGDTALYELESAMNKTYMEVESRWPWKGRVVCHYPTTLIERVLFTLKTLHYDVPETEKLNYLENTIECLEIYQEARQSIDKDKNFQIITQLTKLAKPAAVIFKELCKEENPISLAGPLGLRIFNLFSIPAVTSLFNEAPLLH